MAYKKKTLSVLRNGEWLGMDKHQKGVVQGNLLATVKRQSPGCEKEKVRRCKGRGGS